MSFVAAAPEIMTSAAKDLADIGSALTAANRAAVTQTTGVLSAAEDEVSAAIAALFSAHGQGFQALSAQAAAFHDQFVQALTAGAGSYVGAEAANASLLQSSNVIAGSMDGVVSRLDNALGDIPPGQSMHTPFIPAANVAAFTANPAASATAAQVAPLQSLNGLATRLAATLGFSPVINPVPGDPDFMSQTTNFGGLFSTTSLADPDDNNFVAASFVSPLFKAAATSGFEPTVRLGAPGQTILTFQSPVAPFLNSSIALPVTDPIAPLFTALLPLGL